MKGGPTMMTASGPNSNGLTDPVKLTSSDLSTCYNWCRFSVPMFLESVSDEYE